MDKERMSSLYHRLSRLIPRTPGEKMITAGLGVDVGVGISIIALHYLQREGITNLTPETAGTIRDVLLWGGHIALSDYMLKLGGVFCMVYLEDENWFKRKVPQPEINKTLRTGKFLVVDSEGMQPQLEGLPSGAVPYVDNKNLLRLGFLSSPHFWNSTISLVFRLYPEKEGELGSEYNMAGQQLKDYLVNRAKTIIDVNRQFLGGTLPGHVAELPYPTHQESS